MDLNSHFVLDCYTGRRCTKRQTEYVTALGRGRARGVQVSYGALVDLAVPLPIPGYTLWARPNV